MARTAVTPTPLVTSASIADPSGTTTGAGAGNGISVTNAAPERTLVRVVGTNAGTVTVYAGTQPGATASGQGALAPSVGSSATLWLGPFEGARFRQADGSITIDTSAVMQVTVFQLPKL